MTETETETDTKLTRICTRCGLSFWGSKLTYLCNMCTKIVQTVMQIKPVCTCAKCPVHGWEKSPKAGK